MWLIVVNSWKHQQTLPPPQIQVGWYRHQGSSNWFSSMSLSGASMLVLFPTEPCFLPWKREEPLSIPINMGSWLLSFRSFESLCPPSDSNIPKPWVWAATTRAVSRSVFFYFVKNRVERRQIWGITQKAMRPISSLGGRRDGTFSSHGLDE